MIIKDTSFRNLIVEWTIMKGMLFLLVSLRIGIYANKCLFFGWCFWCSTNGFLLNFNYSWILFRKKISVNICSIISKKNQNTNVVWKNQLYIWTETKNNNKWFGKKVLSSHIQVFFSEKPIFFVPILTNLLEKIKIK
jgi:hypothetical protein